MAYKLNGDNNEGAGFEKAIADFALRAVHESLGMVTLTNVVSPTQGNVFEIPNFAPITWADYNPSGTGGFSGDALEQTPALAQTSITATPTVAATAFDIFYGYTTSFQLAATLGMEIGDAFNEKVDQRVTGAFKSFKQTTGDTMYPVSADGYERVKEIGAIELAADESVLGMIRAVKQKWAKARLTGNPVLVLDSESTMNRLLEELTGGAVTEGAERGGSLSRLGEELLESGRIQNIYGVTVVFSSFLHTVGTNFVGAYFDSQALYTVIRNGLEIKTGEKPGGLQAWLTGIAYFGSGVGDMRRGGAVLIAKE